MVPIETWRSIVVSLRRIRARQSAIYPAPSRVDEEVKQSRDEAIDSLRELADWLESGGEAPDVGVIEV